MPALLFPSEGLYFFLLDTQAVRRAACFRFTLYLPLLSDARLGSAVGGGGIAHLWQ